MIEPTDEMVRAFMRAYAEADDGSSKVILEDAAEKAGLAAVLALVERDYEITTRPCQWCGVPPGHHYLSTGCLHEDHDYCQNSTGAAGAKTPAQCKFCAAPCRCTCHAGGTP